jgi:hypothetical protein
VASDHPSGQSDTFHAAADVLAGRAAWSVEVGDNLPWLEALPEGCLSLVMTSPPYEKARTYGVDFNLAGQAWVDFMVPRVVAMCRATNGLVCVNMAGQVRGHQYQPVVEWLVADLTRHHGIVCGPAPYVYFRFGIPGSGGKRYHRRDWEPVYCFARPEVLPLAWSDNTAEGKPPIHRQGGEMSYRGIDGHRVNEVRRMNLTTSGTKNGDTTYRATRSPIPAIANPGNVVREHYDAEEVRQLVAGLVTRDIEPGDVVRCLVGGGQMGSRAAHDSEAPFSERLVEFFVRSYAPPGGIVCDPFSGSGTTGAVAVRLGRRFAGCDLRPGQCGVARGRIAGETPGLFAEGGGPASSD